jgi:Na+-transporting NADH:ubiquinone oxidoreductase subunit A
MIFVEIGKGYKINIAGEPSHEVVPSEKPSRVALLPERIPFVKPRLKVKVGDKVKMGTPIFEDKRNPDVIFLSPAGGEIAQINFGPRRVIKEIVVALDHNEDQEAFPIFNETQIESIQRKELAKAILAGGLWPLLRELPFRDIADPDFTPPFIIVSLDAMEPFQAAPEVYLKDKIALFEFGIKILRKLSEKVFISTSTDNAFVLQKLNGYVSHTINGVYPSDDPGVLLYHIKKTQAENKAWYINGQDVLLLAGLLKTGKYPIERTVVLGGNMVNEKKHILTRTGVPLDHLIRGRTDKTMEARYIVGGIFRGYIGTKDSYMGFYETSLVLIPEGGEKEFFGFMRPGFRKPSRSRAFLSFFNKSTLPMDCNFHGEERACINCGSCAEVCPVDILPQFTYKCILADEIEDALGHGMLDCVECGLCTYVCPSKVELCETLKKTKKAYYLEQL